MFTTIRRVTVLLVLALATSLGAGLMTPAAAHTTTYPHHASETYCWDTAPVFGKPGEIDINVNADAWYGGSEQFAWRAHLQKWNASTQTWQLVASTTWKAKATGGFPAEYTWKVGKGYYRTYADFYWYATGKYHYSTLSSTYYKVPTWGLGLSPMPISTPYCQVL